MAEIRVLPSTIAQLIAAGEVVERPSAVIKELVENSIDAGASIITVEIESGGIRYMRITDNGHGIARAQVPNAFLRHATSKIATEQDLERIGTLGFRGEALASVAAMCKVELLTRTQDEALGTRYVIEGGTELICDDAGCPIGSTLVVRDIFYNTPARMKFLKKDVTEGNSVEALLDKMAMSHPEVAFKLIRDGAVKLQTPGDSKLLSAIHSVYDKEYATGLMAVDYQREGYHLTGYICKPERAKPSRAYQNFYINARFIKSKTCLTALEQAYKHAVMVGKFPYCVLHIKMNPQLLDVNVHPAKTEVRFAEEKTVFDLVYYGCKNALSTLGQATNAADRSRQINALNLASSLIEGQQQRLDAPQIAFRDMPHATTITAPTTIAAQAKATSAPQPMLTQWQNVAAQAQPNNGDKPIVSIPPLAAWSKQPEIPLAAKKAGGAPRPVAATAPSPTPQPEAEATPPPDYTPLGELFCAYILVQAGDELLLVDKHAAHERILFQRLQQENKQQTRQLLLVPTAVNLDKEHYGAALQHIDAFLQLGFAIEDFGAGTVLVRESPLLLPAEDIKSIVEEIAAKLHRGARELTTTALDDLLHSVACRAAVKAGSHSARQEQEEILRLLREDTSVRNCPHGRPVMISLSKKEIEKLFGRA